MTAGAARGAARCGGCGAELAAAALAIEVDGAHEVVRRNAAGVTFRVRLFSAAPGCAPGGAATDEDTWFAGHTWRRLFCARCSRHAGWVFRSRAQVFAALVD